MEQVSEASDEWFPQVGPSVAIKRDERHGRKQALLTNGQLRHSMFAVQYLIRVLQHGFELRVRPAGRISASRRTPTWRSRFDALKTGEPHSAELRRRAR